MDKRRRYDSDSDNDDVDALPPLSRGRRTEQQQEPQGGGGGQQYQQRYAVVSDDLFLSLGMPELMEETNGGRGEQEAPSTWLGGQDDDDGGGGGRAPHGEKDEKKAFVKAAHSVSAAAPVGATSMAQLVNPSRHLRQTPVLPLQSDNTFITSNNTTASSSTGDSFAASSLFLRRNAEMDGRTRQFLLPVLAMCGVEGRTSGDAWLTNYRPASASVASAAAHKEAGWPNRFGIQPGWRWDGIVRGTGAEGTYFPQ